MRMADTDKAKTIENEEKLSNGKKNLLGGALTSTAMLMTLTGQAVSEKGFEVMVILPAIICAAAIWSGCISTRKLLKEIGG